MSDWVWKSDQASVPTIGGWYRVLHSGDSEYLEGHKIYDFEDYQGWAYWTPAPDEHLEDFEGGYKGSWKTEHDEEGEFIKAWFGPVNVPQILPISKAS